MKRRTAPLALSVFVLLGAIYFFTAGGHMYSPDDEVLFRTTEAVATRGSLAIAPLMGFATRRPEPARPDGREYAQYGVGQPILAAPFCLAGRFLASRFSAEQWLALITATDAEYPLPMGAGSGAPKTVGETALGAAERFAVSFFNLFVTAGAGTLLFLLALRLTGHGKASWLAALAWGAGSLAWPHARTFFTEPLAGFCVLFSLLLLARAARFDRSSGETTDARPTRLPVFAAGVAAGYGCLVRLDSVVFLPALAALVFWMDMAPSDRLGRGIVRQFARPEAWMRLILFALPVAAAGGAILGLNWRHFGHPLASGYSDQPEGIAFSTPVLAGLHGFTMSVGRGLFFFSPALLPALWGFGPMLRRRPVFGAGILLAIAGFLVFQSCWRNWTGGWCWGPRHIYQIHGLLALPVAFWIAERWTPVRRVAFATLLAVGVGVQVYGCSQNFITYYRIYFQDPREPVARPLYEEQTWALIHSRYVILPRDPRTGGPVPGARPLSPTVLPAPTNDSIVTVQNSVWPRYAEMWRLGYHDFLWLHVWEMDGRDAGR